MATYLLIIGDREALGWILTSRQMAFPSARRSEVRSLQVADRLLLYTTRSAFRSPTCDRGQVIGAATVMSGVSILKQPVHFGDRDYPVGCHLDVGPLLPRREGVQLAPLVSQLETFAKLGQAWSILLRRPLLLLSERDAKLIENRLDELLRERRDQDVVCEYSKWYRDAVAKKS